jgi:very-short-patch-repair endonuclease
MEDKKVCEKCGVLVSKFAYNRHLKSCTGDPKKFRGGEKHFKKKFVFTGVCQYCGKLCKNNNSQRNHERLCKDNPNRDSFSGFDNPHFGRKGSNQFIKARKLGLPVPISGNKGKPSTFKGKKHSEETKRKISEKRIKFLKENPDKVPYLMNHYSKSISYPEQYFIKVFEKEKISLKHHKQINVYQLDFYNDTKKIYLEIDGDQHFLDKRIVASDKRRRKFLYERGWKELRLRWSSYKKLSLIERKKIVSTIRDLVN